MSSESAVPAKKLPVAKIVVVLLVVAVTGFLLLRGVNLREQLDHGMALVRSAGPTVFFLAMALTPLVGAPMMPFNLAAGPLFGEQLGMPLVLALSLTALTANMVITYALARRALRPLLERLIVRLGYKLPNMDAGDLTDLTILLRVTPGTPFFIQNYLLGLAGVPLGRYLLISCIVQWSYTTAFVLFGDALLHGKGKMALFALSVLVVAVVLTHWLRKRAARKKAAVA